MEGLVLTRTVSVLEPVADVAEIANRPASRVPDLHGRTLGLLDNGQVNAELFLTRVGDLLVQRYGVARVVHRCKGFWTKPAGPEIVDELATRCDAVVTGWGS